MKKIITFIITYGIVFLIIAIIIVGLFDFFKWEIDNHNWTQLILSVLASIYPSIKLSSYIERKGFLSFTFSFFKKNKIFNHLTELILPILLTILLSEFITLKNVGSAFEITMSFSVLFFLILFIEWYRRYRNKHIVLTYRKYIYVGVIFFVFILGIWYSSLLIDTY